MLTLLYLIVAKEGEGGALCLFHASVITHLPHYLATYYHLYMKRFVNQPDVIRV